MSVLRHGSSLQRRLTKLYTDTKSSWEIVSTAAKPNDDPELIALDLLTRNLGGAGTANTGQWQKVADTGKLPCIGNDTSKGSASISAGDFSARRNCARI
ncbi:MAG: hypothetical protein M1816_003343 [Peltula sp. TS41687]|nr:MAG: hypothetical protein M1816_003343 [Peltula sp. TS41687]